MLNIVSYNVNGIRAALRKNFLGWLETFNPDILCLQEIKANKGIKNIFTIKGDNNAYFRSTVNRFDHYLTTFRVVIFLQ